MDPYFDENESADIKIKCSDGRIIYYSKYLLAKYSSIKLTKSDEILQLNYSSEVVSTTLFYIDNKALKWVNNYDSSRFYKRKLCRLFEEISKETLLDIYRFIQKHDFVSLHYYITILLSHCVEDKIKYIMKDVVDEDDDSTKQFITDIGDPVLALKLIILRFNRIEANNKSLIEDVMNDIKLLHNKVDSKSNIVARINLDLIIGKLNKLID